MSQKYSQDEAQALVKALKEGNQLAFSIVYKTYAAQTFSLAFKYLLNKGNHSIFRLDISC